MNYRFNIDEWLPRFPLQERNGHYSAEIITSPWHLCQNEQLRRELKDEYDWGPPVPVDVFVMADGEPPDRHVTKIGGLPYRPADAEWPMLDDGSPMVFLAQLNFCDSKDLMVDLPCEVPGDILLVFVDNVSTPQSFHFEWQRFPITNLIAREAVPEPTAPQDPMLALVKPEFREEALRQFPDLAHAPSATNEFKPCYGHVFRTVCYPEADREQFLSRPLVRRKDVHSAYWLPCYQATQIGEAPFFIQEDDLFEMIGEPLCVISSVQPASDVPFPWMNREAPIPLDQYEDRHKYLMIGDMGCIYISIDEAGIVYGHWSCY